MKRSSLWLLLAAVPVLVFFPLVLFKARDRFFRPAPPVLGPMVPGPDGAMRQGVLPDLRAVDQNGKPIRWEDFRGRLVVVDFFFTRCASICPRMSSSLERVQRATAKDGDRVSLLSFTIDPENDGAEALRAYAARFGADETRWRFARTDAATVARLATDHFKVMVGAKDQESGQILHGPHFVLVDEERRIRGWYDGTDAARVDELLADISVLLRR